MGENPVNAGADTGPAAGFEAHIPEEPTSPLVVSVPHAGTETAGLGAALHPALDLRFDADLHVDRLYRGLVPGAFVVARLSRFVCDLNRPADDVLPDVVPEHPSPRPASQRGFVWRSTTAGAPVLTRPLSLAEWHARAAVHAAYHGAIATALEQARRRFGFAILIDGHSMPSMGRGGQAGHSDAGQRRAEVVPGDRDGSSCAPWLRRMVVQAFNQDGFTVAPNDPYRGGFITSHHGRPHDDIHALQIEVRRDLYMDEESYTIRDPGLARLRGTLARLLSDLDRVRP